MIRHDYPAIQKWLLNIYWDNSDETRGAFRKTTHFEAVSLESYARTVSADSKRQIKEGYAKASKLPVVPKGPLPSMLPRQ